MTMPPIKPTRILAIADTGPRQVALETAMALAETHGATLDLVTCVEPPHDLSILSRLSGEDADCLLDDLIERTRDTIRTRIAAVAGAPTTEPKVLVGKEYLEIIRHVAATGCDFVVKSAEPLAGMQRFLFASTDQHLLRKCPCPVWLQTPQAPARPKRVLAAIDLDIWDADEPETLTTLNRRMIDMARTVAKIQGGEVVVLHAWDALGEGMIWAFSGSGPRLSAEHYVNEVLDARHAAMDRFLAPMREDAGASVPLIPRLVRGTPERVIQEQAHALGADLVVMGTIARTGLSGVFIGNTAENIINSLDGPVLAVKPAGFVSPLLGG